jgi:hypothetical protein
MRAGQCIRDDALRLSVTLRGGRTGNIVHHISLLVMLVVIIVALLLSRLSSSPAQGGD